jgi:hypothetical protein
MSASLHPHPRDAAIPAVINAAINGAIAYNGHKHMASVPLSVDSISSAEPTVWAEAVMIALALALILSQITAAVFFRGIRKAHPEAADRLIRPLFPGVTGIALKNTLVLFGATVALAVMWQRLVGTVMVSPLTAAVLVALLAAIVTVLVDVWTKQALLQRAGVQVSHD